MKMKQLTPETLESRIVFIPVGMIEAHGSHLPLGTDTYIAEHLAKLGAEAVDGVVAPSVHYGTTTNIQEYGTIDICPKVFQAYIESLITEFLRHFETIIFVNGHAGNSKPLYDAIRNATPKDDGDTVILFNWFDTVHLVSDHAGPNETAVMKRCNPGLVGKENYEHSRMSMKGFSVYPSGTSIIKVPKPPEPDGNTPLGFDAMVSAFIDGLRGVV